jgi:type IV pilus assembly protein PilC
MKNRIEKFRVFKWKGINKQGFRVAGKLFAFNVVLAQKELRRQGIEPLSVKKYTRIFTSRKRIKTLDISLISRHLATMITAGIPLVQALEIISKGVNKISVHTLLQTIKHDVASGKSFHESLSDYPQYFSGLFVSLIKAGEISSTLDIMLQRLANYLEKIATLKKRIQKAMYYPIIILGFSLIVTTMLLIFIIPQFEALFKSFGTNLPMMTRNIINLSKFFKSYWYFILAIIGISIGLLYKLRQSPKLCKTFDSILLRLPIFGKLMQKTITTRVIQTLATMLSSGIPLLEALETASMVANNAVYTRAILGMRDKISIGQQLHVTMKTSGVFTTMVVQMVAVGEESGEITMMLNKIADFYNEDVENLVDGLGSLIEPIIIIILALIIGSFVLAMYLPIFSLGAI